MNGITLRGMVLGLLVVGAVLMLSCTRELIQESPDIHPSSCGGWDGVENDYCSFDTTGRGITIQSYSCTQVNSCLQLYPGSSIGEGSCKWEWACYSNSGSIGDGSCNSASVCKNNFGAIGDNACNPPPERKTGDGSRPDTTCLENQDIIPDNSRNDD